MPILTVGTAREVTHLEPIETVLGGRYQAGFAYSINEGARHRAEAVRCDREGVS